MKILVVLVEILVVSFAAATPDTDRSLKYDVVELKALLPTQELNELAEYYYNNDEEYRNIIDSGYISQMDDIFKAQPEFREFDEWISEQMGHVFVENTKQLDFNVLNNYKPGWKAYMEIYIDLFPFEEIAKYVEEKVAEGGIFAEYWSRQQGLKPAYERVIRSPEFINIVKILEELGFDGKQYDGFLRNSYGWN